MYQHTFSDPVCPIIHAYSLVLEYLSGSCQTLKQEPIPLLVAIVDQEVPLLTLGRITPTAHQPKVAVAHADLPVEGPFGVTPKCTQGFGGNSLS